MWGDWVLSERRYLFFKEWVAKYIRFCNYPANDHGAGGLNRIYLATAKAGGPPQAERLSERTQSPQVDKHKCLPSLTSGKSTYVRMNWPLV